MGCAGSKATGSKEQERPSNSDGYKEEIAPSEMQTGEQGTQGEPDMPAPLRQSVYRGRRGSVREQFPTAAFSFLFLARQANFPASIIAGVSSSR